MSSRTPARIDGIVARQANVAMIFRRGPSEWCRGYLWSFDTDEVAPGDWVHARVYTERCDLSPDGRYLIASFFDYGSLGPLIAGWPELDEPRWRKWSSLSRAPNFAPLAIWARPQEYGAEGYWRTSSGQPLSESHAGDWNTAWGEHRLRLSGWQLTQTRIAEIANVHDEEHRRRMLAMGSPSYDGTAESMRALQEWYFVQMAKHRPLMIQFQTEEMTKSFSGGLLVRVKSNKTVHWELRSQSGKLVREFRSKPHQPQWIDLDHSGRVVYSELGCLWAWEDFPKGKPKLIADLNGPGPGEAEPLRWDTAE